MWLYLPDTSPYSPASEDSTWPSSSLCRTLSASAWWRGKSLPPKSWRRVCTKALSTTRLSGLTSELSAANRGAASWMASLADSHAPTYPSPESGPESTVRSRGCGESSDVSSTKPSPDGSLSKTSQDWSQASLFSTDPTFWNTTTDFGTPRKQRGIVGTLKLTSSGYTGDFSKNTGSPLCSMSAASWKNWVTELRSRKLQRRTLALRTSGSGSSSWPTPRAGDLQDKVGGKARIKNGRAVRESGEDFSMSLLSTAERWPSPRSEDAESCGNHPGATDSLTGAVGQWSTPKVNCGEHPGRIKHKPGQELHLDIQANNWQTPATDSFRSRGGDRKDEQGLDQQARLWTTPQAHDSAGGNPKRVRRHGTKHGCANLADDVMLWRTPDAPGSGGPRNRQNSIGNGHQVTIAEQAEHFSLPAPTTPTPGAKCWCGDPGCGRQSHKRKLNPLFVTFLMNWPVWWCHKEPMPYARRAMASWLSKGRWRLWSLCGDFSSEQAR